MAKKILFADDDPAILEVVKIILEEEGFDVTVTNKPEKVKSIKGNFPDLILLDIRMSGVDGREIAKHLKGQKSTMNIPVILISANKDTEKDAKEAGADGFISKPFELDDLVATVKKFLKD